VIGAVLWAACVVTLTTPVRASPLADRIDIPPPPPVAPGASEPSTPAGGRLVSQLARLQDFPQTRPDGVVGLAVIDSASRQLAYRNADRPMLPASTMKLVTAAAALRLLGPGHRFVTRVFATSEVDADGVVDGDLVIVGGGDPVLATPTFMRHVNSERPATPLAAWPAPVSPESPVAWSVIRRCWPTSRWRTVGPLATWRRSTRAEAPV
jgi:hypothetical protein